VNFELNQWETLNVKQIKQANSVALLRIRNEELIIQDTLSHLSEIVDVICIYDDSSTDKTLEISIGHPKVLLAIQNTNWLPEINDRLISETRHRALLLKYASLLYNPKWFLCCDADERYFGQIKEFFDYQYENNAPVGIRVSLFDAYMTKEDSEPVNTESKLVNFRKYFGLERRDILMIWNREADAKFIGLDAREPTINSLTKNDFYAQHYGKSLSIEQWEETCNYYARHFPEETYGEKWRNRKGRAIHEVSDFGTPLKAWGDDLFNQAIQIHPLKEG
jgi:hypothetical protein